MQLWFPDIVNRISNAGNSSASTVCDILDNSNLEMENDTAMEAVVNKIANLIILFTYVYMILSDVFRSHIEQNIYRQLGCWSCVSNWVFDTRIST